MTGTRRVATGRRRGGFLRQSATSSTAALLALLSGLLLDVALAARFGAGRQSDAFFVAARIPIGLTAVLMQVATQALVPLFTRERRGGGPREMTGFASRVLTAALGGGALVWALATLLARPLVSLTAPGLSATQVSLAASMIPAMFLVVPLVAAAETVRAALNASYSFVLPAAMNLFMNSLAAGLILGSGGHDIHTVAWAYVAGASFQLVVITVVAWLHGVRIHLSRHVGDERVRAALRLSGRPTLSSVLNLGNRVAEQLLVSFLPAGSITVLSYGQRLISALGGGIFFRPVTVTLLPRLADAEHAGDGAAVSALVARALKFVLAIALPLTAFTVALAEPAIRLVFHRGSFGPTAVHLLALTLALYGASLVGSGLQRILLAPFYARLDTRTPLRNTAYGVVVDLVLLLPALALLGRHRPEGVLGVALAYSVTQYAIVAHAWWRLRRTLSLRLSSLLGFTAAGLLASAVGGAGMLWQVDRLRLASLDSRPRLLVATTAIGLAGALVMAAVAAACFVAANGRPRGRLAGLGGLGGPSRRADDSHSGDYDEQSADYNASGWVPRPADPIAAGLPDHSASSSKDNGSSSRSTSS